MLTFPGIQPVAGKAVPVDTAPELSVETVSDYPSFLDLEPVWNHLVEAAGPAGSMDHPFLRHEWVRTWWECFGAGKELHILVVKSGDEAIAIAPLMLSRVRIYGFLVRRLGFLQNDHTPRFDFILAREPAKACLAIWSHLLTHAERWDVLELRHLPAGSPTVGCFPLFARDNGYLIGLRHAEDSPYLPFSGGWNGYAKRLSHNHRAKIRKGLNRLTRIGHVRLEAISGGDGGKSLAGALEDGLRIEAAAWKEKAGTAISSQPDVRRFYKIFAERAARIGALRLFFLTVDRARIAFAYALFYRNKLYVLKAGYDPDYARYSPYNLLCYLVFQDAFERGLDAYEFLGSNEPWKLDWTKETKPHFWLFVFPKGLRLRFLYFTKCRLVPVLQRHRLYRVLRDGIIKCMSRPGRG